jgi:hypothetical protein
VVCYGDIDAGDGCQLRGCGHICCKGCLRQHIVRTSPPPTHTHTHARTRTLSRSSLPSVAFYTILSDESLAFVILSWVHFVSTEGPLCFNRRVHIVSTEGSPRCFNRSYYAQLPAPTNILHPT